MRIGYLSNFTHHWNTESEIADYLELVGHEVCRNQYDDFSRPDFLAQDFDLVLTALPQWIEPGFWAAVKAPKIAWYFDLIFGFRGRDRQYIPALRNFDLVLSTDGYEDKYSAHGILRLWMPHGFDGKKYHPVESDPGYECPLAFIGQVYGKRRRRLMRGLRPLGLRQFGADSGSCWGEVYNKICSSAQIVVGDNAENDIPGYWSDRLYLSLGAGAFLLYPAVPGIESQFSPGEHLVLWHDEDDLHAKVRYYLAHEDERREIARAGCRHAHLHHTTAHRVDEFNRILESTLSPISRLPTSTGLVGCSTTVASRGTRPSACRPRGIGTRRRRIIRRWRMRLRLCQSTP